MYVEAVCVCVCVGGSEYLIFNGGGEGECHKTIIIFHA
jgi:hypothetical protein